MLMSPWSFLFLQVTTTALSSAGPPSFHLAYPNLLYGLVETLFSQSSLISPSPLSRLGQCNTLIPLPPESQHGLCDITSENAWHRAGRQKILWTNQENLQKLN